MPDVGGTCLALTLALRPHPAIDDELRARAEAAVRRNPGPFPLALEWQRLLLESRRAWRSGHWRESRRLLRTARETLDTLACPENGELGAAAVAIGRRWIEEAGFPVQERVSVPPAPVQVAESERCGVAAIEASLSAVRDALRPFKRAVVWSARARELEALARFLESGTPLFQCVRAAGGLPVDLGRPLLLVTPEIWEPARVVEAAHAIRRARPDRLVTLTTCRLERLRGLSPAHAALVEEADGALVELPPLLAGRDARLQAFRSRLGEIRPAARAGDDLLDEVGAYDWPGGLAELEAVAAALAAVGSDELTARDLTRVGWEDRAGDALIGMHRVDADVMRALRDRRGATIGDLCAELRAPRRTLQRALARLLAGGRIARQGRGRATSYAPRGR